jgi:hypothetical protein
MTGKLFAAALLAAGLVAWAAPARAADPFRPDMTGEKAPTRTLKAAPEDLRADAFAVGRGSHAHHHAHHAHHHSHHYGHHAHHHHGHHVHHHHAHHHRVHHHAHHSHHHGHHAHHHHGHHVHHHHAHHRHAYYYPRYGYGSYRPYYYPRYAYGYYRPYGYPRSFSFSPGLGYPYYPYSYPAYGYPYYSGDYGVVGGAPADPPPVPLSGEEGASPDDGGPGELIPLPKDEPATPPGTPREAPSPKERAISSPVPGGRWVYPAYGEAPRRAAPAAGRPTVATAQKAVR